MSTPGPWKRGKKTLVELVEDEVEYILGPSDEMICLEPVRIFHYPSSEPFVEITHHEGNMNLLMAAPDLLLACKRALHNGIPCDSDAYNVLRAAIWKAEGKTPLEKDARILEEIRGKEAGQ